MNRLGPRERGTAAVELALLMTVLLALLAIVFPLGGEALDRMRLEQAASEAVRFATAAPNTQTYPASGRRPDPSDVTQDVIADLKADGVNVTDSNLSVTVVPNPTDGGPGGLPPIGQNVTVTVRYTYDLGVTGSIATALNLAKSTDYTITVTAVGREE